jgi:cob(I)alamin adenosyltransferase
MVRATVRKAERGLVVLSETRDINPLLIMFMNRLSDYFFVLARHLNDLGKNDILWNPSGEVHGNRAGMTQSSTTCLTDKQN